MAAEIEVETTQSHTHRRCGSGQDDIGEQVGELKL